MMNDAVPTRVTVEDLSSMPDEKDFELVDGELVDRYMGNEASSVAVNLLVLLGVFNRQHRVGVLLESEAGYQCFPDAADRVRKPDVSFIALGRLPHNRPARGYDTIPPDLAVEVLSPRDVAVEVDVKVEEYLRAGVRLVWIVNPDTRTVRIHRADGTITGLHENDELTGEDVLPGFTCKVAEIFEFPAP
jgi:Uma2 family endonuclease